MTVMSESGLVRPGMHAVRPGLASGLRRLWRLLRRARRGRETYFSLSQFDQRLIYDLGIEPLELRSIASGRQSEVILRLRRMRRRSAARQRSRWADGL